MLAAVFEGEGRLALREAPEPGMIRADDVLLRVDAASICGTDLHILETPPGHPATPHTILGHEYTGTVLETGPDVTTVAVGDRVVVNPNPPCHVCRYCRLGLPNMCENLVTLGIFRDGAFAAKTVAPAAALYRIDPRVPVELAALAEPLSCVVNATTQVALHSGQTAVVLGAGPIGCLFTQLFAAAGAGRIIVSEVSSFRQEIARASGATDIVDPRGSDLRAFVDEHTGGGADVVVDSVGALFPQAIHLARPGGQVVLFGMNDQAAGAIPQSVITRRELTIRGSYIARDTFPLAVRIIESGRLPLDRLITHRLPLHEIESGLGLLRCGEAMKVIITPSDVGDGSRE